MHQRSRLVCLGAAVAALVAAIAGLVGPATAVEAGSFVGLPPARLADSRPGGPTVDGVLSGGDARAAGSVTTVPVAGRASVPSTAAAVSLNVTVTEAAGPGYATVYPCGADTPTASNLNFATGQTIANSVVVKVGQGGAVCIYVSQATQLIVDIGGYFPTGSSFVGSAPARLADSRPGGPTVDGILSGGDTRAARSVTTVPVAGRASVPATAAAVSLNVTVTEAAGPGYATVYPCGADTPTASNLNFATGQTIANSVVVKVGQGGAVCIYVSQATQLIVDIGGYFPAEGTSTTLPTTTVPTTSVPPTTSSVPPSTTSTSTPPATSVPTNPIAFAKNTVFIVQSSQIKYWVYVPGSYDSTHQTPTTLLVWLHGCGGRSADDIRTVSPGGSQDWISITVDGREGACWNPAADGAKVKATIADVKTHFNIDPHRVILGGYSSGGDLAYRTAFYDAGAFAGVLAENTSPFRDTGSSRTASLAAASWKFPVIHLAHLQDTTYPIAGVRTETDAMTSAGFPVTRIERDGGHYDILGAIENGHAVPGTDADLVALLLPHIHDGWRSP